MNRLQNESSPYLRQHENNPVDWFPWGEEALQKAKNENKVILVSIGYSACHWCHVMAHESFENKQIGAIMNKYFVNIKVDREERPDVDSIYMDALHAMGLRGGWPLNVFLMPNAKPFYGGTYFPVKNWQNLLLGIQNAFENEKEKLVESSEGFARTLNAKISEQIQLLDIKSNSSDIWSTDEIIKLQNSLQVTFDSENGGMQNVPKFPMPSIWQFLLSSLNRNQNSELLHHLKLTLDRISLGGIYDHVSGGWTRYSTDANWKVPHFEKMLYDNGQLIELYSSAYLFFSQNNIHSDSQKLYKWAVEKCISWLKKEMTNEFGGFYAALDADSEGVEGKYYVWGNEEIIDLLGSKSSGFSELYNITPEGNWEDRKNILHLESIPSYEDWQKLDENWSVLNKALKSRIRPGLDDKIICSWNALMLTGLVKAYSVFKDKSVLDLILKNLIYFQNEFIRKDSNGNGLALWHLGTGKKIYGFLDDYASSIQALTEVYQITFNEEYLRIAKGLAIYVRDNFYDKEDGLFFFTDSKAEKLIARKKEIYDNVIPSSNSMLASAFIAIGHLTSDFDLIDMAKGMIAKLKKTILDNPSYMSYWALAGLNTQNDLPEVVVLGPSAIKVMQDLRQRLSIPVYFAGGLNESDLPLLKGRFKGDGKTYIYVCKNQTCKLPTNSMDEALAQIHEV